MIKEELRNKSNPIPADIRLTIDEILTSIQNELNVPKNQYNNFGKYAYRNCEDICQAIKPILLKFKTSLRLSDEVVLIGQRFYVKATAKLCYKQFDVTDEIISYGYAREEETKKGMDGSQISGASSSYARKYALNGLFLIDDTKDSDFTNKHDKTEVKKVSSSLITLTDEQIEQIISTNKTEVVLKNIGIRYDLTVSQIEVLNNSLTLNK
jgi:hypothetical protein